MIWRGPEDETRRSLNGKHSRSGLRGHSNILYFSRFRRIKISTRARRQAHSRTSLNQINRASLETTRTTLASPRYSATTSRIIPPGRPRRASGLDSSSRTMLAVCLAITTTSLADRALCLGSRPAALATLPMLKAQPCSEGLSRTMQELASTMPILAACSAARTTKMRASRAAPAFSETQIIKQAALDSSETMLGSSRIIREASRACSEGPSHSLRTMRANRSLYLVGRRRLQREEASSDSRTQIPLEQALRTLKHRIRVAAFSARSQQGQDQACLAALPRILPQEAASSAGRAVSQRRACSPEARPTLSRQACLDSRIKRTLQEAASSGKPILPTRLARVSSAVPIKVTRISRALSANSQRACLAVNRIRVVSLLSRSSKLRPRARHLSSPALVSRATRSSQDFNLAVASRDSRWVPLARALRRRTHNRR